MDKKEYRIKRFRELAGLHKKRSDVRYKEAFLIKATGGALTKAQQKKINDLEKVALDHESKAEFFLNRATAAEKSNYILSDDPDAILKISKKIDEWLHLNAEMLAANRHYKETGEIKEHDLYDANFRRIQAKAHGQPFSVTELARNRHRVRVYRNRIKALRQSDDFEPFTLNGCRVELLGGQIRVDLPFKPDIEQRKQLKSLRLKWSTFNKKWVRKYTGQDDTWLAELKKAIKKITS